MAIMKDKAMKEMGFARPFGRELAVGASPVSYTHLCAIDEKGEFVQERAEIVFYSSIGRWLRSALGGGQ